MAGYDLWADHAIEARPDVLWLVHQSWRPARITWAKKQMTGGELPTPGTLLLVRTDAKSGEDRHYGRKFDSVHLRRLTVSRVREYEFTLYQFVLESPIPLPK